LILYKLFVISLTIGFVLFNNDFPHSTTNKTTR